MTASSASTDSTPSIDSVASSAAMTSTGSDAPPDPRLPVLRGGCHGLPPVSARIESWKVELCSDAGRLARLVEEHGSPLNLHHAGPFERNLERLRSVATARDVELEILFARKADKALVYVDAARDLGAGVDTASEAELVQALDRGCPPELLVSTAAVKTEGLVRRCIAAGVAVVIDNRDELDRVSRIADAAGTVTPVVVRVGGFRVGDATLASRFGIEVGGVVALGATLAEDHGHLRLHGLHFHLDGYAAADRIAALARSLDLVDALRGQGHPVTSIDIGGGLPMSYVDDGEQWQTFERELRRAVAGERAPITYRNNGLGLRPAGDGEVSGELATYPYHQSPTAADWLAQILDARVAGDTGETIAEALRRRRLTLRCEPGRSLLDGCGMTVARVEHRKRHPDGTWSLGVAMNRTQCATAKPDHALDPLLLSVDNADEERTPPIEGFLMGAYCTEAELLTWRRLRFPRGVARGDLVVFPNTAGYLMHFVESRSHQFPLARNVVVGDDGEVTVDAIDAG